MGPVGQIVDRHHPIGETARRLFPARIQPVMVNDHPVKLRLILNLFGQGRQVRLPRQRRLYVLVFFSAITCGQRIGDIALIRQPQQQVPRQFAASKAHIGAIVAQRIGQRQAAGDVATADGQRGVGADQHAHHASSPPALSAAYRYSARCQSSGYRCPAPDAGAESPAG